jgi:hypothetical protein
MPPRWSRVPDRKDPDYRQLDDRMTFAVHVLAFAAVNSGLWFFQLVLKTNWNWSLWLAGAWFTVLAAHAVYIFAIADYSESKS